MRQDSKLIHKALQMTVDDSVAVDEGLLQLVHDVQGCLHLIGLGMEMLKGARDDETGFIDTAETIDQQRREAGRLLAEYLRAARAKE